MATPETGQEPVEAMAFQLILHKLETLETQMKLIPPLLATMVHHLDAQTHETAVEVATYAQLYPALEESEAKPLPDVGAADPLPTRPPARSWRRWFLKEA